MQRPTALDVSPMEEQNLSFDEADEKAHLDSKAVHALEYMQQPLTSVQEETTA